MLNKKNPKPDGQKETMADYNYRLKQVAKLLAEKHKDKKPTKYLLK